MNKDIRDAYKEPEPVKESPDDQLLRADRSLLGVQAQLRLGYLTKQLERENGDNG